MRVVKSLRISSATMLPPKRRIPCLPCSSPCSRNRADLARFHNQGPWLKGHKLRCRRLRGEQWEDRLLGLRRFLLVDPRRLPAAIWPRFLLLPALLPGAAWHRAVLRRKQALAR